MHTPNIVFLPRNQDWRADCLHRLGIPLRHSYRGGLCIEYVASADMDDGAPLPPLIEDDIVWRVVRHADGCTLWRRIFLASSVDAGARRREINQHTRYQENDSGHEKI